MHPLHDCCKRRQERTPLVDRPSHWGLGLACHLIALAVLTVAAFAQTPPTPTPAYKAQVRRACSLALNDVEASKILNPAPYIETCVNDALLMGTLELVEIHKAAYFNQVKAIAPSFSPPAPRQ